MHGGGSRFDPGLLHTRVLYSFERGLLMADRGFSSGDLAFCGVMRRGAWVVGQVERRCLLALVGGSG